ncbi:snoRNP complex protein nop56 [Rhizoclosmatium sp. JEL0117]|nr:snoRNP complex protein nop56 [Rhizoclosmatium sp. JEL0117]
MRNNDNEEVYWECSDCQVENTDADTECASCGAEKPRSRLHGFKVAKVLALEHVPGKALLKVVKVTVDPAVSDPDHPSAVLSIVTNAKNVSEETVGQRISIITVGTTVRLNGEEVTIAKTSVGGKKSEGMLADGATMGWKGGSVGLAVVLPDTYPIGTLFVLFESASGYALFERVQGEEIGQELEEVQKAALDLAKFGRYMKLKSFAPFKSAAHALENIMDVTEGIVNDHLKSFLELNMPSGKKSGAQLGVGEKTLAGSIKQLMGYDCVSNETVTELIRGLRLHGDKMLRQLKEGDFYRAQLGLGHSYSRAKVKFNVNRSDNMIIQAINLLDQLDKDVNTFSMRVREWYGWHFPELVKVVSDNLLYARCCKFIRNKSNLTEDSIPHLEAILNQDAAKARQVLHAAQASMGTDIAEIDLTNIEAFADRVISLTEYRARLHAYLVSKMHQVAPNLSALIGEMVGARLISHAGSLTNLCKYPASTVQILGAEKALFRALKTRGNTPKYGLIYHSTFIGRAATKNKGRISRILANKCSIASRIDCFLEKPTSKFGEVLKAQVEERLKFYEDGTTPRKNTEVMGAVVKELGDLNGHDEVPTGSKRKADDGEKKKKKKKAAEAEAEADAEESGEKKKKKKKAAEAEEETESAEKPKKKKKKASE